MKSNLTMLLCGLVLLAALVLSGCGGGGATTVTVTSGPDESATAASTGGEDETGEQTPQELEDELEGDQVRADEAAEKEAGEEESQCDEMGINSEGLKEGRCADSEDLTVYVANHNKPARIRTLGVELVGTHKTDVIEGEFNEAIHAENEFLTVELKVTNRSHSPEEFEESQVQLLINGNSYSTDFEPSNGYETNSFLWIGKPIQPETAMVGTVTFDLASKVIADLYKTGNINVSNFGEEVEEADELAIIRTYH